MSDEKTTAQNHCILNELRKNQTFLQVDQRKEIIKENFLSMLKSATTMEQVDIFDKAIAPIGPILAGMSSTNFSTNCKTPVHAKITVPHNKKILPQRRMFTTKKSKTKRKAKVSKPNSEESNAIAYNLML